jgi:hypothetical protein
MIKQGKLIENTSLFLRVINQSIIHPSIHQPINQLMVHPYQQIINDNQHEITLK